MFLVASPGTEALVAEEARQRLPDARVDEQPGGVTLTGDASLVRRANLWLRLPTRVLLRIGEVEAREFSRLRRGAAQLPFSSLLPPGSKVALRAAASKSRLYHTGAITENVALALADAVGAVESKDEDAFSILVRGHEDRFTLSLDTSGDRLHQRGWRTEGGAAPLRETLAAALLAIAAPKADEAVVDPMCGSGTIIIEAALQAIGRAPGLDRGFAFTRFADHDEAMWQALRESARASERPRVLSIVGADADEEQIAVAQRNAARAGVEGFLTLRHAPLDTLTPAAASGVVVSNPPYGKRVGARSSLPPLYRQLGALLRGAFSGWRAAILVEDRALLPAVGVDHSRARALTNGGIRVWVGLRGAKR